jgi:transcriptional regulator with XRE-family HTH domain
MTNLNFADKEFSGERFRHWFAQTIKMKAELTVENIAEELGYMRHHTVKQWIDGKSFPNWAQLPKLAELLDVDQAILIPLFIEAQISDVDVREEVFEAACHTVPRWEYPMIEIARSIYIDGNPAVWDYYKPGYLS